ncbi:hypothetical protein ACFYTQ_20890 [Nocardia sp. NPDC004068]|uniref:hypothetical protein n=1 Tax=Nocardia sp. NPDC004068 TaxID=3364303 RepID=UPI0036B637C7
MKRPAVTKETIKRVARSSTKASAKLERRIVPPNYQRSERVEKFLAEHRSRTGK